MPQHAPNHGSHNLPKPEKAKGTRSTIKATAPPGGRGTPGAKAETANARLTEAQTTDSNNEEK